MHAAARIWRSAFVLAALFAGIGSAAAGTIDKMRADGAIRIAYREDAPPFSYREASNPAPGGYMVELCQAVARRLGEQLKLPSLKVSYVAVTAANRFEAIEKGRADLLCEPTSATLARRKHVDFSIATFVDGASLLTRDPNLRGLGGLAGRKVGVLAGTTTEQGLHASLKAEKVDAEVVPAATHVEGLAMIDRGDIQAYFADRGILMFLLASSRDPHALSIADNYLTVEPYALALPRGDEDFRLEVDTALSHIYRSGEIGKVFDRTFSNRIRPTEMLKALYLLSSLPD